MAQQNVPAQAKPQTIQYANLLGVDYQNDATEIDRRRSPDMVNMISDLGGNPVKRHGYHRIGNAYSAMVTIGDDIYALKQTAYGSTDDSYDIEIISISINNVGDLEETARTFLASKGTRITNFCRINHAFAQNGYIYILANNCWIEYDPEKRVHYEIGLRRSAEGEDGTWSYNNDNYIVLNKPISRFIPTVYTMYKPNGRELINLPSGTDITGATQGVNILTPWRSVEYCVTTDTAGEVEFTIPNCKYIHDTIHVSILDPTTFEWSPPDKQGIYFVRSGSQFSPTCMTPDGKSWAPTWVAEPRIKFVTAPYTAQTVGDETHLVFTSNTGVRVPAGVPNVRITYAPCNVDGNYKDYYREDRAALLASNAIELYDGRVFVGYKNRTYYSRASAPFNIDDNFYFDIDTNVMGYAKTSSSIAIIGEDTGKDTIYLASGSYSEKDAMMMYQVRASSSGVGSIAYKVKGIFNDEPILLSHRGLFGITTNYWSEKYAISRSGKINRRLCDENNLENAVGVAWNGYYFVAVNRHMYVLDGRHKDTSKNGDNSYECYYFEGLPDIKDMFVIDNRMYFTDSYYTYSWSDKLRGIAQYLDDAVYDKSLEMFVGKPVKAKWASCIDGDGAPHYYKVLNKKGTMVTLAYNESTSCRVTIIKDGYTEYYIGRFDGGTFSLGNAALDGFTKKKIKKYKRLQFVVENVDPEPFSILSVIKTFTIGNYAKR